MANQILQYLPSTRVFFPESATRYTKKRVFEEASILFQTSGVARQLSFNALFARERLGNNSLGNGTLIPHCRIPNLSAPMACLVILKDPIVVDPHPIDGKPVDLFFFLLVPEDEDDESFLDLLHESIALLKDENLCRKIRACSNSIEVCEEILNWEPPANLSTKKKEDELSDEWAKLEKENRSDFVSDVATPSAT